MVQVTDILVPVDTVEGNQATLDRLPITGTPLAKEMSGRGMEVETTGFEAKVRAVNQKLVKVVE